MSETDLTPKKDYVKILKSLSAEQWIYVICAVCIIGYGLNMWIGSMLSRNNSNQNPQLVATVEQADSTADNEAKKARFTRVYQNRELTDGSKLTQAERNEKLVTIVGDPVPKDKTFKYSVSVPTGWKSSDSAGSGAINREHASFPLSMTVEKYYGPAEIDMIPVFKIDFEDISHQISAETLMNNYLLKRSITPLGIKVVSENRVEAMYMDVIEQSTFVFRTLFMINGKTSVIVSIAVPIDIYEQYAEVMGAVTNSFKFDETPVIAAEEVENFSLMGVLSVDYFKSWELTNVNDESSMNLSFQLYNRAADKKTLNGLIEIKALRINKNVLIEDVLKEYIDVMKKRGITINKMIESKKIENLKQDYNYAVLEIYDAGLLTRIDKKLEGVVSEDKMIVTPQFFQLASINNGNYIIFVSLLGPTEQNDTYEYGRNIAQFDKVVRDLKIRERK